MDVVMGVLPRRFLNEPEPAEPLQIILEDRVLHPSAMNFKPAFSPWHGLILWLEGGGLLPEALWLRRQT